MFHLCAALSGPQAVSQVIWRALGPREWLRPHAVQDWAGLLSGPIESPAVVAWRYDITRQTLLNWRTIVRDFAAGLEVPTPVALLLTWPTEPGEDHAARRRQASLFGLQVSGVAPSPAPLGPARGLFLEAKRILAVLGEIPVGELTAALNRARPSVRPEPVTNRQVKTLLARSTSIAMPDGRVRLTRHVQPRAADVALLDAARASGRTVHSYDQARELLTAAGYARSLQPTLTYHPLLRHESRGRYSVRLPSK